MSRTELEGMGKTAVAWRLPAQLAALSGAEVNDLDGAGENVVEEAVDETDAASRAQVNAILRRTIGERIAEARRLNGWDQGEFAQAMGCANSTQVSLWEAGKRLPPLPLLLNAARVLGVSVDYLAGETSEFERDAKLAARSGVFKRVERLLRHNVDTVAQCLLDACSSSGADEMRVAKYATHARMLCDAVERFRELNPDLFDEARGGATLLRTCRDMKESLGRVDRFLTRAAHSRIHALSRARDLTLARTATHHLEPTFN